MRTTSVRCQYQHQALAVTPAVEPKVIIFGMVRRTPPPGQPRAPGRYSRCVRPPVCVACGLPVLELVGQSVTLSPYLSVNGSPPADSAGSWHLLCVTAAPVGGEWQRAVVRSYREVRQYELVGMTPQWAVVRNPRTGEVLGLGPGGVALPLSAPALRRAGGAYRVSEAEYWLEWDEPVILEIQDHLRRTGVVSVHDVAGLLGMGHRLSHPDLLADSVFRLDPSLASQWRATMVGAPVEYSVYLPDELAPYYAG